jgi:tRNA pseudouridine55 synthase
VTVHRLAVVGLDGDRLTLEVDCSAGFYVRALAHDVGARLGTGAHLAALRRTRCGDLTLDGAVPLASIDGHPDAARVAIVPLRLLLLSLDACWLTGAGARRAGHGCDLGPEDFAEPLMGTAERSCVRLVGPGGDLVGLARSVGPGARLHPFVVLV